MIIEATSQDSQKIGILHTIIPWFTSFQSNSLELLHYTDGLRGCGSFLEQKLGKVFCSILRLLVDQLLKTQDAKLASSMIQVFNCKFKSGDFQVLAEDIHIFPILFRGQKSDAVKSDQPETSLIAKCNSFYRASEDEDELCKNLLSTQKEIFLAIIARIGQGDSQEQMKIK